MDTMIFLGEFFGTMILILLGNGVGANVSLAQTNAKDAGWLVITTGWAFAVAMGVFVALAFGAPAHLNPAVTIGMAVSSNDYSNVLPFLSAQFLGAFVGSILVWIHYYPHWEVTKDADAKFGCFATSPAIDNRVMNMISEIIGTFVLVMGVGAIFAGELAPGLGPFLVGALVWSIGLSLGGTTGYAINPARDLSPRIAHQILPIPGKGSSNFSYAIVPVLGPLIGGVLAGLFMIAFPVF